MSKSVREQIAEEWSIIAAAAQTLQAINAIESSELWGIVQPAAEEQIKNSMEKIEILKPNRF